MVFEIKNNHVYILAEFLHEYLYLPYIKTFGGN
jgi:hypothetical protein